MANHRHDITVTARPGAQNAKAILGIMVGDALDEARQHLLGRWLRMYTHGFAASSIPPHRSWHYNAATLQGSGRAWAGARYSTSSGLI
jgi:hypothetical protein